VNPQLPGEVGIPVFAGDTLLQIRIPSLQILCSDTKTYEDYRLVLDREIRGQVEYIQEIVK
jgi:hypothetical protein